MRFGPPIARDLRSRRPRPHGQWHLDEMFVTIGGKWMYLWRAVDAEGEVLDCLVQSRRDKRAAKKLMRKLLEEARLCSKPSRHRPSQVLPCGFPRDGAHHPPTGAKDARLEVGEISSAVPLSPRSHLQHLQHVSSPHLRQSPNIQTRSYDHVA